MYSSSPIKCNYLNLVQSSTKRCNSPIKRNLLTIGQSLWGICVRCAGRVACSTAYFIEVNYVQTFKATVKKFLLGFH
ncbi:hypothetical protein [Vibrio phage vB_VpaP_AL-1]|nr:hypothetical protein [Vibrio phage vB_VpaP_AL-1]